MYHKHQLQWRVRDWMVLYNINITLITCSRYYSPYSWQTIDVVFSHGSIQSDREKSLSIFLLQQCENMPYMNFEHAVKYLFFNHALSVDKWQFKRYWIGTRLWIKTLHFYIGDKLWQWNSTIHNKNSTKGVIVQ